MRWRRPAERDETVHPATAFGRAALGKEPAGQGEGFGNGGFTCDEFDGFCSVGAQDQGLACALNADVGGGVLQNRRRAAIDGKAELPGQGEVRCGGQCGAELSGDGVGVVFLCPEGGEEDVAAGFGLRIRVNHAKVPQARN